MLIKGRNSLDSDFWTYWFFWIALVKLSEGQTVLSSVLQRATADLSLVPGRSQTENSEKSPVAHGWAAVCSWHVELVVPGELGVSAFTNETKAEPGRSQHGSSVFLHQYCMLNIILLEEAFKEICDLQGPAPGCRTNWKPECFHRIQTMSVTKDREHTCIQLQHKQLRNSDSRTLLNPRHVLYFTHDSTHLAL